MAPEDVPADLCAPFIRCLEQLMLAQAQECVWQRAVMGVLLSILRRYGFDLLFFCFYLDNYKNGLIAKLAAKV